MNTQEYAASLGRWEAFETYADLPDPPCDEDEDEDEDASTCADCPAYAAGLCREYEDEADPEEPASHCDAWQEGEVARWQRTTTT